jgi:hypothetical protein
VLVNWAETMMESPGHGSLGLIVNPLMENIGAVGTGGEFVLEDDGCGVDGDEVEDGVESSDDGVEDVEDGWVDCGEAELLGSVSGFEALVCEK